MNSWREAMRPFYLGRDGSHDIHHAEAVARCTQSLCETSAPPIEGVDLEVAVGAAWCHDVLDSKYCADDAPERQPRRDRLLSAAEAVLSDADAARRVLAIAETVSFTARVSRGGKAPPGLSGRDVALYYCVSDADMLEAMGAIGVVRTCVYQASRHPKDEDAVGAIETALSYTDGTLTRCVDLMVHPLARAEAEKRKTMMLMLAEMARVERHWRATAPRVALMPDPRHAEAE